MCYTDLVPAPPLMSLFVLPYAFIALATFLSLITNDTSERYIKGGHRAAAITGCLVASAAWPLLLTVRLLRTIFS
jgi:hypothetical protein